MKHLFVILILLIQLKLSAQVPDSLKVISLPPPEFQQAFMSDTNALLIDVREFFEFRKSRIINSINIPSSGDIQATTDTLNKNLGLFLYCTSGFRSKRAGIKFYDNGLTKVWSLDGGISAWRKAGMAVDKKKLKKKDKRK